MPLEARGAFYNYMDTDGGFLLLDNDHNQSRNETEFYNQRLI